MKVDGVVDYNNESHAFTAKADPTQSLKIEYLNSKDYDEGLDFAIHSNHLDLPI
ncbi:MAG: hypothetical protein PV340_04715 [Wolbachia sp.]|nr:hypothetical protein [Wolbachia sp.]MDD9336049.1 hypothetical protein [Wolbachia sp.]